MKQNNFFELLKNIKINQQINRKIKIFIGISLSVILIVVVLFVWVGVKAVKQVVSLGNDPQLQEKIQNFKGEIKDIPALAKVGCRDKVQGLLNVGVWLEKPIADNLKVLRWPALRMNQQVRSSDYGALSSIVVPHDG